jgi:hypothetical protein
MSERHHRWLHLNKYQIRILVLLLLPAVVITTTLALFSNLFFEQLVAAVESGSKEQMMSLLATWKTSFFFALWVLLSLIVLATYVVCQQLLGAFTRIFRELDEVIAGQSVRRPITARKGDDLANELLKRINLITQRGGAALNS